MIFCPESVQTYLAGQLSLLAGAFLVIGFLGRALLDRALRGTTSASDEFVDCMRLFLRVEAALLGSREDHPNRACCHASEGRDFLG